MFLFSSHTNVSFRDKGVKYEKLFIGKTNAYKIKTYDVEQHKEGRNACGGFTNSKVVASLCVFKPSSFVAFKGLGLEFDIVIVFDCFRGHVNITYYHRHY